MKFAAIDFETANYRSDSPCQVAVVIVDEGRRIEERSWLIRPKNLYFSDRCVAVHGIRPRDVIDQPEWDRVWSELAPMIDGHVLIAHNAMFDLAVLASTLSSYDLVCPRIEFQCTRLIARRCWPGRTGYGLKPTADALGIAFQHHIAIEDARVCAEVALAAARVSEASDLESLEHRLSIRRGCLEYGNRIGPRCIRRSKSNEPSGRSRPSKAARSSPKLQAQTILDGCSGIRPFENKRLYLTGSLLGLEPDDAIDFLKQLGGIVDEALSAETDFWILGIPSEDACSEPPPQNSGMQTADPSPQAPTASTGCTLVIHQRQLLAMIPGGLTAARAMS